MSRLMSFVIGIAVGVYVDQQYKLPRLKLLIEKGKEYLESIEKK